MMIRRNAILPIVFARVVSAMAQKAVPESGMTCRTRRPLFCSLKVPSTYAGWQLPGSSSSVEEVEAHSPGVSGLARDLGIIYYHLGNFVDAV